VATGYDPLLDNEPELARTMAASVQQRIAFGERAGEKVRHIGSGAALDGVLGLSSGQDDILGYLVDADRVGAAGSSFGGYTVMKTPRSKLRGIKRKIAF
jgi:predicted dienelactone hydrolase